MSSLKEIRTRINSVGSTRKITSAMKMVSAAKFHKAQETLVRFEPYSRRLLAVLAQTFLSKTMSDQDFWFELPEKYEHDTLIVISSNSSMCAGFNQNLAKYVNEEAHKHFPDTWGTDRLKVICLGKKCSDLLSKRGIKIAETNTVLVDKPCPQFSFDYAQKLLESYCNRESGRVMVAYNRFKNPAVQEPVIQQFLPIILPDEVVKKRVQPDSHTLFEPSKEHIISVIIPKAMQNQFHNFILENAIGEHGARMTAMHQATDNATGLIKDLTLQYNKARQAAITKEILEIVSGAEALKG